LHIYKKKICITPQNKNHSIQVWIYCLCSRDVLVLNTESVCNKTCQECWQLVCITKPMFYLNIQYWYSDTKKTTY